MHEDTRFVSRWELRLDGRPLSLLKSGPVDYDSAAFFLTNPDTPRLRAHSVAVRRLRLVGGGALEQIEVFNTSSELDQLRVAAPLRGGLRRSLRDQERRPRPQRQHRRRRCRPTFAALPVPGVRVPRGDDDPDRAQRDRRGGNGARRRCGEAPHRGDGRRLGARAATPLLAPDIGQGRRAGEQRHLRAGGRAVSAGGSSPSRGR